MLETQKMAWSDWLILAVGLVGLASAPIFIRLSEQEIGSFATVFDRTSVASLMLWIGYGITRVSNREPTPKTQTPTPKLLLFLFLSGACGAMTLMLCGPGLVSKPRSPIPICSITLPQFS
jgi:drug/metabolite transporter (DMT)-like permease